MKQDLKFIIIILQLFVMIKLIFWFIILKRKI